MRGINTTLSKKSAEDLDLEPRTGNVLAGDIGIAYVLVLQVEAEPVHAFKDFVPLGIFDYRLSTALAETNFIFGHNCRPFEILPYCKFTGMIT